MTEPSSARPVPGPPRPGTASGETGHASPPSVDGPQATEPATEPAPGNRFTGLEQRPVDEHVAVFEEEHSRLQRELGTIDQL